MNIEPARIVTEDAIAKAYWAFEKPWQAYRKRHPADLRPASECGDQAVAEAAKAFLELKRSWNAQHPGDWGIAPSGRPMHMKLLRIENGSTRIYGS